MKKAILIQARSSSKRFPGKMLKPLGGIPLVEFVYNRCAICGAAAVITSSDHTDDELTICCKSKNIPVYRGSLENVLERYVKAAEFFNVELICRVCGDSPFVDVEVINGMFTKAEDEALDYITVDKDRCIPGLDSEVVTLDALKKSLSAASTGYHFEHVTTYIKDNKASFNMKIVDRDLKPSDLTDAKVTVDLPDDLKLCNEISKTIGTRNDFTSNDIFEALRKTKKG